MDSPSVRVEDFRLDLLPNASYRRMMIQIQSPIQWRVHMPRASNLGRDHRSPRALVVFPMAIAALAATLLCSVSARAQSNRCPDDTIELGQAIPGEVSQIQSLWKDLHGVGKHGGDGPLGCPVAQPEAVADSNQTWQGVKQQFQRGWILIGRESSNNTQIAVIKGVGGWTIWFNKLPPKVLPTVIGVSTTDSRAAQWPRGGQVFAIPESDLVSLLQCSGNQTYSGSNITSNGCTQLTPILFVPDRPFDAAAKLDEHLLTTPDVGALQKRVDAIFPNWLPCHTRTPTADEVGEDAFARAMIMMRRNEQCPLTGRSPTQEVKQWLSTLTFPSDMLPGTTVDNEQFPVFCAARNGELDVTLVQLLRLTQNLTILNGPVLDHIKKLIDPWGVGARKIPYVLPSADCLGFLYIESENHLLLQESSSYLISYLMNRDYSSNRDWIIKYLDQISRRDFYEFNSIPYSRYQLKGLFLLHDYAPDERVRTMAKGVLDEIFAKEAFSANLDRDYRPYRRRFEDAHLLPRDWWGAAATPVTTETALLVGPLQHAHSDVDLQFDPDPKAVTKILRDVTQFPKLGTAPGYCAAALVDAANTGYRLPEALTGWLERRYTVEESNRLTYLQAINHVPKTPEDPAIFAQANSGTELVSGNRNWTMIAGGAPAPPGDPGPPPEASVFEGNFTVAGSMAGALVGAYVGSLAGPAGTLVGAIVGAIIGGIAGHTAPKDIAADFQHQKLWETQAGTIRETTLIPTPGGLDRSQTIRFGRSIVTTEDSQIARLCVAEGFMCGYDLRMPTRAFPATDALNCPIKEDLPAALNDAFQKRVGPAQTITSVMGCLVKNRGFLSDGNWTIWTFENGMLALGLSDPPGEERFAGAWIEGRTEKFVRHLRVAWDIRGDGYDWFRVHLYEKSVTPRGGEPPGGWIEPLPVVGNPSDRTKESAGDTSIKIPDSTDPDFVVPSWDMLIVGCTKKYIFGVLRGHDCTDSKMPRLTVNIGPLPKQSFSCAVPPIPPVNPQFQNLRREGVVLEVGSCKGGPYGLFVYVWSKQCPPVIPDLHSGGCPEGAIDYGFVVVAPSRGLKPDEFRNIIEISMASFRVVAKEYAPGPESQFIDIPLSPPVIHGANGFTPTAPPSNHTVQFRWPELTRSSVIRDASALTLFDPVALGGPYQNWPTALGHVFAPDIPGASNTLMRNSGKGCFTVAGFPTPTDQNPMGLLVDFRNLAAPIVSDRRTNELGTLCPDETH
jgi:Glycine zipper